MVDGGDHLRLNGQWIRRPVLFVSEHRWWLVAAGGIFSAVPGHPFRIDVDAVLSRGDDDLAALIRHLSGRDWVRRTVPDLVEAVRFLRSASSAFIRPERGTASAARR